MAEDKNKELELDKAGKNKKLIIIIVIAVVLIAGGAGAFFFMGADEAPISQAQVDAALSSDDGTAQPVTSAEPSAKTGTALYVAMPRPFSFNVPGAARDRFVEIRVQLLVRGGDNEETAKKHIPLLESTLLSIFSMANADDLATSAGKTSLKQQALAEVQKIMKELTGNVTVEKVLFTGFVMQ